MAYKHVDINGYKHELKDLSYNHLINIIKMIKRKSKVGVAFVYSIEAGEEYVDFLYGKEAKKVLNYKKYINELKKRKP